MSTVRRGTPPRGLWPDGMRPNATRRNRAASGQLVGSWTRIRRPAAASTRAEPPPCAADSSCRPDIGSSHRCAASLGCSSHDGNADRQRSRPPGHRARHWRGQNVVRMVVFRPFHRLKAAVVAVAAPHNAGLRPMAAQALVHMLDNGAHLAALRRARRRAQDRRRRRALDRCEAALVVMRVPERQLLASRTTQNVSSMSRTSSPT